MNLLLDTSVIIDYLRFPKKPNSQILQVAKKYSDFYISDITLAEFYAGKQIWQSKEKMKQIESILEHLQNIPLNDKICRLAGQIRAQQDIALMDALIGATALTNELPVATLNTKDFAKIPGLKLIAIN